MLRIFVCLFLFISINFVSAKTNQKHSHKKSAHNNHKKHKKVAKRNYMQGTASYYGGDDGFDGRQMANGDIFDSNDINVAAHPTLPLGTKLMVEDLSSGRIIYVEVTDRMPKEGRVIDLSIGGAKALGMHSRGTESVRLTVISDAEYEKKKNTIEVEDGDDGQPH